MTFSNAIPAEPSVDGPSAGLVCQLGLLLVLAVTVGLGVVGWLVGIGVGLVTWALLRDGVQRSRLRSLGPANRVTLIRTILVGGVTALAADAVLGATSDAAAFGVVGRSIKATVLIGLAVVALALDGVDGQVARRTGSSSPFGARFDMEVDAFLILVLSGYLVPTLGAWVLAIGGMRYAFVLATWFLPWLTAPLPPSFGRKTVAVVQGVALVIVASGLLPQIGMITIVGSALGSLCWSFGRDVHWLHRTRPAGASMTAPVPAPVPASVCEALPAGPVGGAVPVGCGAVMGANGGRTI